MSPLSFSLPQLKRIISDSQFDFTDKNEVLNRLVYQFCEYYLPWPGGRPLLFPCNYAFINPWRNEVEYFWKRKSRCASLGSFEMCSLTPISSLSVIFDLWNIKKMEFLKRKRDFWAHCKAKKYSLKKKVTYLAQEKKFFVENFWKWRKKHLKFLKKNSCKNFCENSLPLSLKKFLPSKIKLESCEAIKSNNTSHNKFWKIRCHCFKSKLLRISRIQGKSTLQSQVWFDEEKISPRMLYSELQCFFLKSLNI